MYDLNFFSKSSTFADDIHPFGQYKEVLVTIEKVENELFDQWRDSRSDLVRDGVVDGKTYLESKRKIMLLMKEVNDPKGGKWDLRRFLVDFLPCFPNRIHYCTSRISTSQQPVKP